MSQVLSADKTAYLSVQNVSQSLGGQLILNDVSFEIAQGDFLSILGPSGSGKTTLLRTIAGLERPDSGSILCDSVAFFTNDSGLYCPTEKRDIGMVFQDFALWPHMTVYQHVAFPLWSRKRRGVLAMTKADIEDQVMSALKMFRMDALAGKRPHQLSGGQQQRVAFARALVSRPKLVLLDEAFSALDPQLREDVRLELVSILRAHKMTVVNVTHDQEEAMSVSDKVLVLGNGRALQFASPAQLYHQPTDRTVATFVGRAHLIPVHYDGKVRYEFPDGTAVDLSPASFPLSHQVNHRVHRAHLLIRPESVRIFTTGDNSLFMDDCGIASDGKQAGWIAKVVSSTRMLGRFEVLVDVERVGKLTAYHDALLVPGSLVQLRVNLPEPHLIYEAL